jgi:hypothetical protein
MQFNYKQFLTWCFTLLVSLYAMFLLSGCSASYHYKKATQKGFKCTLVNDTIVIDRIDSVIINGVKTYYVTKYDTIIQTNSVYIPKTRYETKIEWRKVRDTIELLRYKTKVKYKVDLRQKKNEKGVNWNLMVICGIVLVFLGYKIFK